MNNEIINKIRSVLKDTRYRTHKLVNDGFLNATQRLYEDIKNGKISATRLIATPFDVIKSNRDAQLFNVVRPLIYSDGRILDNYIRADDTISFDFVDINVNYYDGILGIRIIYLPNAVNEDDKILVEISEYM